ncbi:metallophosphoesterase family protein [bacterium]|nr:metallophosphoesterase family protein [bacterium]
MAKEILLISDSHGYSDEKLLEHAAAVDEVWHAGDWGGIELSDQIVQKTPIRGVFGNIDGTIIRKVYPKELIFDCEGLKVYMIHIGGYPGRYAKGILDKLQLIKPDLFITGHSHICKVVKDKKLNLLHFDPGAIGNKGFHKVRTMLRFKVSQGKIEDLRVIEYEKNFKDQTTSTH